MAAKKDPNEVVHAHVKPGETVILGDKAFGDRATLQVPRHVAKELAVDEVDPHDLPDVARR